jgi:hypothetical protein
MQLDLRPLTLAELLDRSFSLYKRHFWLFVGIMAVPAAFAMLPMVSMRIARSPVARTLPPEKALLYVLPMALGIIIFTLLYMVVYMYAVGAASIAVSDLYLGRDSTVGSAYRRVRPLGWRLVLLLLWTILSILGACFVVGVTVVAFAFLVSFVARPLGVLVAVFAFLGVLVVFVWMTVRMGVSVPVLVVEKVTAATALKRSFELTEGNVGRVFLIVLCATVVAYATALIFTGPFSVAALAVGPETRTALLLNISGAISGAIGGMLSGPVMIIGLAMVYYDLRTRKEALDLELLLANVDEPRAAEPT